MNDTIKKLILSMLFLTGIIIPASAEAFPDNPAKDRRASRAVEELKDKSPSQRGRELDRMVNSVPDVAARVIQRLLEENENGKNEERNNRQKALLVSELGRTEVAGSTDVIKQYLEDENDRVRLMAASALAGSGQNGALEELKSVALDDNRRRGSRSLAVRSLGKIESPEAVEVLIEILKEDDYALRLQAVMSLGRIGTDGAYEAIETLRDDPHENVREAVENYLSGREGLNEATE
ncbi:MAG: HEAT repeat domain-containing protein [Elusimicrobiota bacterium]